jgi:hypothetical protein
MNDDPSRFLLLWNRKYSPSRFFASGARNLPRCIAPFKLCDCRYVFLRMVRFFPQKQGFPRQIDGFQAVAMGLSATKRRTGGKRMRVSG